MFTPFKQVWDDAVVRNVAALGAVAAQILAVLSVYGGMDVGSLPRAVHARIIRVLRPAESALRRLIVIAARDVVVEPVQPRTTSGRSRMSPRKPASNMSFQLFDPRKRFNARRVTYTTLTPRVYFIAPEAPFSPLFPQAKSPDQLLSSAPTADRHIGARRLALRLKALTAALEDIPRHAKRLVRLRWKRETQQPPRAFLPLRPGKPPGHRSIVYHEVDDILAECHKFALGVLSEARSDTS
jgi:hypothetical protein